MKKTPYAHVLLKPQSKVALVAPAFTFDSKLFEQGLSMLKNRYGLNPIVMGNAHKKHGYFAGRDDERLEDLYHALVNPEYEAVFAIRGGYGCARIFPELVKRLKKNRAKLKPKIVMGYSDLTILLNGLYQEFGWVTFHGPVLVGPAFYEPQPLEEVSFSKAVFTGELLGELRDEGMICMKPGLAKGTLVGGCLTLLVNSIGTSYEIETDGKVLFIEEVGERPYRVDRALIQLLHAGKLDKVKAIVFGQMQGCDPDPKDSSATDVQTAIYYALSDFLKTKKIPVVYNFPAGHGRPQLTFPIGRTVEVCADPKGSFVKFL